MTISLAQSAGAVSAPSTTSATVSLPSAATAGRILWVAAGLDKNAGTITGPSGFTTVMTSSSTSVSMWLGYKVAAGGETSFTVSRSTTSGSGDGLWVGEFADSAASGLWQITGSASNPTSETAVTSWPSGTTGTPTAIPSAALAAFAIDTAFSNAAGSQSWSNSYVELRAWDTGGVDGHADIAVGWLSSVSAATSTTHTHSPGADQVSGAVVTFAPVSAGVTGTGALPLVATLTGAATVDPGGTGVLASTATLTGSASVDRYATGVLALAVTMDGVTTAVAGRFPTSETGVRSSVNERSECQRDKPLMDTETKVSSCCGRNTTMPLSAT